MVSFKLTNKEGKGDRNVSFFFVKKFGNVIILFYICIVNQLKKSIMGFVDFKITIWERVYIDDDKIDMVVEKIKNGEVVSSDDMYTQFEDRVAIHNEVMYDTGEQMTLDENGGNSTIEVYNGNHDDVYTNAVK